MAERLGEALLELGTDDRKLKRGLKGAERRTQQTIATIGKLFGALVTIAAVRGIVRSIDRILTKFDALANTADKLGLTTEALQEMRFAAERSGLTIQNFDLAFQRFTRRAAEAAAGTGEAKAALQELGFTLDDLRSKSPDELFTQAADALADVERESERLRLAFKLFDSEGVAVVNMVENLRELRQEARDLGVVLSDDLVRDAAKMKNEMIKAIAAIDAAWSFFVINFVRGMDVIFGFMPDTLTEQLDDRIDELRTLQNRLAAIAGEVARGGPSPDLEIERLNERQGLLQKEIRTITELAEVRKKAAEFGAAGIKGGAADDDTRVKTIDGVTRAIENQIGALSEQALAFELSGGALAENIALNRAANTLRREGIELTADESDLINQFAADLRDQADALIATAEAHRTAAEAAAEHNRKMERLSDSFADAIVNITDAASALDALQRILTRFLSQQARSGFGDLFGKLLGAGASLFSGGGGFQAPTGAPLSAGPFGHGGSFTVGGRGGTDRNLVAFNASRGERVRIDKPGAASGVEVNVYAPPGSTVEQDRQQVGDMERINIVIDQATAQNMRPGTLTARALRTVYGQRQQLIAR